MNNQFEQTLINELETKKKLSKSSISLYIRNLQKIAQVDHLKNFNFLKKYDDVMTFIDDYSDNTKRSMLISIVSCLKVSDKINEDLFNKYYKAMLDINNKIKLIPTTIKSDSQKENWITYTEVIKIYENLKDECLLFKENKTITEKQYNKYLQYLVLSLYIEIDPRRNLDYIKMNIIKKWTDQMSSDSNYLDITNNQFIFNIYKTSKKLGIQKIPFNTNFKEILLTYLKYRKIKLIKKDDIIPLLVDYDNQALIQSNSITRILNKIFKKNISSSMLRHIFITSKYKGVDEERAATAVRMGHSIQTQNEYIKD